VHGLVPGGAVLDADVHERVSAPTSPDTGRDALALDVIRAVGPRGHYLDVRHTRDGLRAMSFSRLTEQVAPDGSRRDPIDVARAEAERILATHHPVPLDDARAREIRRILRAADGDVAPVGGHGGAATPRQRAATATEPAYDDPVAVLSPEQRAHRARGRVASARASASAWIPSALGASSPGRAPPSAPPTPA
jgi:hypothetical protein